MARRHLKSPRSVSVRSLHLTFVTKWSQSWSWMTYSHPLCSMSIGPPILRYSYFKIWQENPWSRTCVWSKVKVTFDLENSKVKVMPIGNIWDLEFSRYVCFSFRGYWTTFGWDIANSIFDLENSRSRSWPRSNPMVTFEVDLEFNRNVCFLFHMAIGPFWLRYSKFHIWPWKFKVKIMDKVKPDGHISGPVLSLCLLFISWQSDHFWLRCSKFNIFGWNVANSIFDLENSRSRSRRKSTKI